MMQKFYGLYKQATVGDCKMAKPSFWEVVQKAKYEAWMSLKGTTSEDAMRNYVEEFKKVLKRIINY